MPLYQSRLRDLCSLNAKETYELSFISCTRFTKFKVKFMLSMI